MTVAGRDPTASREVSPDRISARPRPLPAEGRTGPVTAGLTPLGLARPRDGCLHVPPGAADDPGRPAPLALLFHGAGGEARQLLSLFSPLADEHGLLLLLVDSRGRTWDVVLGDYGPDVAFVDLALGHVFDRHAVDPLRVAVGGFSDGASYALSLALMNGGLFTHVLAFSPGFMAPAAQHGAPRIFVSHGVRDQVLPIDYCSRLLVPQLRAAGYDVRYDEFDGPHTVPPEIAREAVGWFFADE